jgi:small subunit ribosomal protein S6
VRDYELVFIIQPDLEDEERVVLVEKVQDWISAVGGQVTKLDYWGQRRLAYTIRKKFNEGYYVLMNLQLPSDGVRELERRFQIAEQVLRYLTVKLDD